MYLKQTKVVKYNEEKHIRLIEEEQVGYWRKNYELDEFIMDIANLDGRDDNCIDFYLNQNQVDKVVEFVKDKIDLVKKDEDSSEVSIFEWEKTLQIFQNALNFYLNENFKENEDRQVIYWKWY